MRLRDAQDVRGVPEPVAVAPDRAGRRGAEVEPIPALVLVRPWAQARIHHALDDVRAVLQRCRVRDRDLHCCCCSAAMRTVARATPTRRSACGWSRRYVAVS